MSNRILLHIGFGNSVTRSQVLAIIQPGSSPIKRFVREKRDEGRLIDATMGKKMRALVISRSGPVFLSAISVASLVARMQEGGGEEPTTRPLRPEAGEDIDGS
ncbi:MAG TPA: DUF370 domain-containing protein [Candidatus Aminicenantes bacterium]|nr:DUF370 domain-containing protein [Candidatus Aminicenantes bacterium]